MFYVQTFLAAIVTSLLTLPLLAGAQSPSTPTTYSGLVQMIIDIINIIIPVILGGLFIFFIWKIVDAWVLHAGDEVKREEGRKYLTAAVVAFVVMVSAWGVVELLRQSLFG